MMLLIWRLVVSGILFAVAIIGAGIFFAVLSDIHVFAAIAGSFLFVLFSFFLLRVLWSSKYPPFFFPQWVHEGAAPIIGFFILLFIVLFVFQFNFLHMIHDFLPE